MARRLVTVIVGETEAGKTTQLIKMIDNYQRGMQTIFDPQFERALRKYPEVPLEWIHKQTKGTYRYTGTDVKGFIDQCLLNYNFKSDKEGHVCFDDSTPHFEQQTYRPLNDLMYGVRHKHLDITFLFHNLWRVPPYIMDAAQIVVIFKTGEHPSKGDVKRFRHGERILEAFEQVSKHPNKHYFKIVKIHGLVSRDIPAKN